MSIKYFRIAITFLTGLPIPAPQDNTPDSFGRAGAWFPVVGLFMGALLVLFGWGLSFILSPAVLGVMLVGAWVLLSGALHLDGLADCCDGLLSANSKERRLEIMKDPRLGTFGGVGLILVLALKIFLAADLAQRGLWIAFPLACSLGRWLLLLAFRQPMARPGGLGEAFARGVRLRDILISAVIPLGLLLWGGIPAWLGAGLAALLALGIFALARRRLGGLTGDVFGMLVELSEVAVLLGVSIHWLG